MAKVQFLMMGRDPVVLQQLLRFVNENPAWEADGTIDDRTANIIFDEKKINVVVWIDDISTESKDKLSNDFKNKKQDTIFIDHYGNSKGLLASEIQEAFKKNNFDPASLVDEVVPTENKDSK
ncbi:MAG: hypothetical protein ABIR31_04060 [Ginsengibacter sp.]